jgi:hypothetical protein
MIEQRIDQFIEAFEAWIQAKEGDIRQAVDQTSKLFHRQDVLHMLQHLQKRVTRESLRAWVSESYREGSKGNVLCLHAGNLPMVGFQDLIAVWLAGHRYQGKLSRKDPILMDSFLRVLSDRVGTDRLEWSTQLEDLTVRASTHIVFAGSALTVPQVRHRLEEEGRAVVGTHWHIRTASFSVAWLKQAESRDYEDLAEAILRYDGAGCRSVKLVVSDQPLTADSCGITDAFEAWWSRQATYRTPSEQTRYDRAVLHAVERPYLMLEHMLLETEGELNGNPDRILWLQGGQERVEALLERHGAKIQSIYGSEHIRQTHITGRTVEPLSGAQDPQVNWCPDGENLIQSITIAYNH